MNSTRSTPGASAATLEHALASKLVLGIETSCDETAASVVAGGVRVLSNTVASQHELHAEYRGVVPEIASRAHAERIVPVIRRACTDAGVKLTDLHAIAIGNRPGLIGSLLVGVAAGKALAMTLDIPLVGVDHVQAHLYAGCLDLDAKTTTPPPHFGSLVPALGLVVSGGHTAIYKVLSPLHQVRLGGTIDDAIGEAYDKVAAMLGLAFPGGPNVDKLACGEPSSPPGDAHRFNFPISRLDKSSLDLSFSGLKTSVLYQLRGVPGERNARPPLEPTPQNIADLCASFQYAAAKAITIKLERAIEQHGPFVGLIAGGGVTANSNLRRELGAFADKHALRLCIPPMDLCVDNAAMIAGLGSYTLASRGWRGDGLDLGAFASGSREPAPVGGALI